MARNGDGLHKRGRHYYFTYRRLDGTFADKSTGKEKLAEARAVRDAELERLSLGQHFTDMSEWKLDQALDEYKEHRQVTHAESSVPPEKTICKHLLRILGSGIRLKQISASLLRHYQVTRRKQVGPKTVNNELGVLRSILRRAKLWKRLEEDYTPLSVPKGGPGQALTVEQGERLIRTAQTKPQWFVAFCTTLLAYSTGCRMNEIKKLQLRDLMLDAASPFIRIRRVNAKNNASAREVALNDHAVWALRALVKRAEMLGAALPEHHLLPENLSRHTKATDPLRGSRGYDPARYQKTWSWDSLRKAAGLAEFRFHDLRHTFITQALEAGAPIEVVMGQVGHASAEMTRYYTHLATKAKHKAVEQVCASNPGLTALLTEDAGCDTEDPDGDRRAYNVER